MSSIRDFIRDALAQADHILLALCAAVNLFGIALIYSATRYDASLHSYPVKQAIAMVTESGALETASKHAHQLIHAACQRVEALYPGTSAAQKITALFTNMLKAAIG